MTEPRQPPIDRFCDLVMKGGITSGVVYPRAIALLAQQYRFRSIGGTSAGAIAAAVTAAAEYQRRQHDSAAGFDILAGLPDDLRKPVARGRSTLLSLFQPQPGTRRLFTVLIHALNSGGTYRRIASIAGGLLVAYWPATLVSVGAAWLLYGHDGWLAAIPGAFLLLLSIAAWVYVDLTRNVVANNYGLCTGMTTAPSKHPALSPWLHDLIQRAAGRTVDDDPLTFGDLWGARGFPPDWLRVSGPVRSIDLQMFSTNLSHGRPYILPLAEPNAGATRYHFRDRLFFDPSEISRYLPKRVFDWMCDKGMPYVVEDDRKHHDPPTAAGAHLLEIPPAADFPVLLAARMSLSFPLLFSAVPLWAIDYDKPAPQDDAPQHQRQFKRCWFSDGGISSNFPMHLFDGMVPLWPTLGIDLEPKLHERRNDVFLPARYEEGFGERWNLFGDDKAPASRLGGFVIAIIGTMQNWNDNALARMPGVRDRVARVRLDEQEGGINLNMKEDLIRRIADRGERAAQQLLDRFAEQPNGAQAQGWDDHRIVRLSVLLKSLVPRMSGVANAIEPGRRHATDFSALIDALKRVAGPGYEHALTPREEEILREDIAALHALAAALSDAFSFEAFPPPQLRVRPPL